MIGFLDRQHAGEATDPLRPPREAMVQVVIETRRGPNQLFELVVNLDAGAVVRREHLEGRHSYIDAAYMKAVEAACISDPRIQDEIKTLDLPPGATVVVEPWAYATDGMIDTAERTSMVSKTSPSKNKQTKKKERNRLHL